MRRTRYNVEAALQRWFIGIKHEQAQNYTTRAPQEERSTTVIPEWRCGFYSMRHISSQLLSSS
jgi:hypothetical protein